MKILKIGRGRGNDIIIQDDFVSKTHCQIIQEDNGNYRLIDTNSTNGTYINGILRRGEIQLNKTDIIKIGNTILPWQSYFKAPTTPQPVFAPPTITTVTPPISLFRFA